MARRRIFAKRRSRRGWHSAVLALGAAVALAAGAKLLLNDSAAFPGCADASVRADLLALLQEETKLAPVESLQLDGVDERKQTFRQGELFARECAAVAQVDGAEERIRFRITRDADHGYVLSLGDA